MWSNYVVNLIKSSPDKSHELDPMPTKLLKENVDVVMPLASETSLSCPYKWVLVTSNLKEALVCPLLKKSSLEANF